MWDTSQPQEGEKHPPGCAEFRPQLFDRVRSSEPPGNGSTSRMRVTLARTKAWGAPQFRWQPIQSLSSLEHGVSHSAARTQSEFVPGHSRVPSLARPLRLETSRAPFAKN